jgi:hypothetical protein
VKRLLLPVFVLVVFGVLASVTAGAPPPISIDVTTPVEATDSAGADVTYHVKSHLNLEVTCTPAGTGMAFNATAHLPIGTSTIACTDSGGNSANATVTVQDTTPPTVNVPSGATGLTNSPSGTAMVNWDPVPATDAVDGALTATCDPSSGSSFPVGQTTVTCRATDSHGNTGVGRFTVTAAVGDTTPPTLTVPGPITQEATSAAGAVVTYTVSATDDSGAAPTVDCGANPSGSIFPIGLTTVTCTAKDPAGNTSAPQSFSVTVQDTTPPNLNLPSDITVEAQSAAGAAVTFSASAIDAVSGSVPVTCTPPSGSTFAIGATTVTCSAGDGAGKTATGSFKVTITDTRGPAFSGVPADRQVEANGPSGSVVNYTLPTATDATDGPELVTCTPASGATFPLGTTAVTCTAADSQGNTSTTSFAVRVVDTTKPSLIVPAPLTVYAETPDGISAGSSAVTRFLGQAHAIDSVDPNPRVWNNAPGFLGVGVHVVTFFAADASGNTTSNDVTLEVLPVPPAGTPPLPVPPAQTIPKDVTALKAEPGDGQVHLSWKLPNGVDHVVVSNQLSAGGETKIIYTGSAEAYTDHGLVNGLEYRYVVVSVDKNGNTSAGVAVTALPKATLLRSPKDGARLKKPPTLVWVRNPEASYYNVQLFRGTEKILSGWPNAARVALPRRWKYQGRTYTLTPGVYRWYVWPGFGARKAVDYGELMGWSSFQIVR